MLRIFLFICGFALVSVGMETSYAEGKQTLRAGIIGLNMKSGDEPGWREPEFDHSDWSQSTYVGNGFNRVLIPDEIGWARTNSFQLPEAFNDFPVALYVITGASFQIYWNGHLIGENGYPAKVRAEEKDALADSRFYIPSHLIDPDSNVIAIRYSAHGYKRLHLPLAFALNIGAYQDARYDRLAGYVPGFLLIGAVGAAAIFFSTLFWLQRGDRAALWLALMFFMVVAQSVAETSRALVSYSYIGHVVRYGTIILSSYGAGLFLLLFIMTFLRVFWLKKWLLGLSHLAVFLIIGLFYSQTEILSYSLLALFVFCASIVAGYGVYLKRSGSKGLLIALMLFGASFIVGHTQFLDNYYYLAMAVLAGALFILQANAFRETEQQAVSAKLKLNRMELELLKRQIQPHFIMNTLTALSEWVLTNPKSSVEMIEALADEFRILNEFSSQELVPLESELNLCRAHLKLMSFRLNQPFQLQTDLEAPDFLIPPAIIHTLVENALSHNRYSGDNNVFLFEQRMHESGDVELVFLPPVGDRLDAALTDQKGRGVGLSYIRARLKENWGTNFSLEFGEDDIGRWRTRILLSDGDGR